MSLPAAQLSSVASWFAAGASLDEIQKRLVAEYGVHLTYLDLRLIVADLPQPKEKEEDADDGRAACPQGDAARSANAPYQDDNSDADDIAGDVTVTVDPITPPGVMAGGGVTFSDGTSGKWYLDQMGRLGLGDIPQGYRPSPEDAALFQTRLVEALRAKGLA